MFVNPFTTACSKTLYYMSVSGVLLLCISFKYETIRDRGTYDSLSLSLYIYIYIFIYKFVIIN
jgi:hypothetical protein